ncbi:hypothetical protein Tco_0823682, partial [Tanacetum coccineum]
AILASSSEVPSVLEFLQRRKLEAKKVSQEVAASEFSHLNHSLSHRPVSVKPDISKASSAGGKLHILKTLLLIVKASADVWDAKRLMANYGVNVLLIKTVMDAKED